ncbi:hypothetical protein NQZ68_007268 [Dissostichus eleginoides]|nr:hypothetical protein NQZ68_007268 [Dissostichus eleginoides]
MQHLLTDRATVSADEEESDSSLWTLQYIRPYKRSLLIFFSNASDETEENSHLCFEVKWQRRFQRIRKP